MKHPLLTAALLLLLAASAAAQPLRSGDETTSEADTASFDYGTGNEAFEAMIHVLVGGAQAALADGGEFYPSALAVTGDGTLASIYPYHEDEEEVLSDTLIERARTMLLDGVQQGTFRATAMLLDIYVTPAGETEKRDAMLVKLEDPNGAKLFFLPYRVADDGTVSYGTSWVRPGDREFFAGGGR